MNCRLLIASTLLAGTAIAPAWAEDGGAGTYPYVEGTLELSLGDDLVVSSGAPGDQINDLFFEGALEIRAGLFHWLAINAGLTLEPVLPPAPFMSRWFGDHGLYMDTLNVEIMLGNFTITAGKFGPGFGTAWDVTPGIYGTGFAEDYETAEQIGFGAAYAIETSMGTHTIGANLFYADNTFLSDSLFTSRGQNAVAAGGVGNTGRLNNFSITLDGTDFPSLPGFSYHIGYRHLTAGIGDVADEHGFVLGLVKETELPNGVVLGVNGEVAYFDNYGGTLDNAYYVTVGTSLQAGPWHGELAGTIRNVNFAAGGAMTDHLLQLSAGYGFDNGIDLSAGYAYVNAAGTPAHIVGLRLAKSFEFSTR